MYCHLSGSDKQRVTAVACCEKIAKLIPLSTSDTPSGNAWPGKIFNGVVSGAWGASSYKHKRWTHDNVEYSHFSLKRHSDIPTNYMRI